MSCPPACLHLCPACPERGTACRQEVRTQQKQKGREEKTLPSLCHKPTNQKKKNHRKKDTHKQQKFTLTLKFNGQSLAPYTISLMFW